MISESMTNNLFRKIALRLAANGSIEEKYIELYVIAMQSLLAMAFNAVTALLIGYLIGMWQQSIILFAAFIPLRSYAGGYHARGYLSCYLESCVITTAILLFLRFITQSSIPPYGMWLLFLAAAAVIFHCVQKKDKNHPAGGNTFSRCPRVQSYRCRLCSDDGSRLKRVFTAAS